MNGLHTATIVLFTCWTLWLLVALWLLGDGRGLALAGFLGIAVLLGFSVGFDWRVYLMAWLGAHILLAARVALGDEPARGLPAVVSLAGLLWLWVQGGAGYWPYVVGVLAGAGCAGLGYGACWLTALRPARRQAAERAELTSQHYQRLQSQYGEERQGRLAVEAELRGQQAEAERLRQSLARARQVNAERAEAQRTEAQRTEARRARIIRAGGEQAGGEQVGGGPGLDAGGLLIVRVRCFTVADETPAAAAGSVRLAIERTAAPAPRGRFAEFTDPAETAAAAPRNRFDELSGPADTAAATPQNRFGKFSGPAETTRTAEAARPVETIAQVETTGPALLPGQQREKGFSDRLSDATADYLAERAGDPAFEAVTERWVTHDSYPEIAAADAFSAANDWLHELVERPLGKFGGEIGLPATVASPAAGIAAGMILEPVAEPLTRATEFCAVAGLVVGAVLGAAPLVLSSVKILAHDGLNRVLAEGVKGAFHEIGTGREADAAPGGDVAGEATEPQRETVPDPQRETSRGALDRSREKLERAAEIRRAEEIDGEIGGFEIGW